MTTIGSVPRAAATPEVPTQTSPTVAPQVINQLQRLAPAVALRETQPWSSVEARIGGESPETRALLQALWTAATPMTDVVFALSPTKAEAQSVTASRATAIIDALALEAARDRAG